MGPTKIMPVQLLPFQKLVDIPDVAQRNRCAIRGLAITSIVLICMILFLFVSASISTVSLYLPTSMILCLMFGIPSMVILFFVISISSAISLHNTDKWVSADVCCNLMRSNPAHCTRSCSGSKHCCARLSCVHIGASVLASLVCVLCVAVLFSGCNDASIYGYYSNGDPYKDHVVDTRRRAADSTDTDDCTYVYIGALCSEWQSLKHTSVLGAGINKANVKARCCGDNSCSAYMVHPSDAYQYATSVTQSLNGVKIGPSCTSSWPIYRKERKGRKERNGPTTAAPTTTTTTTTAPPPTAPAATNDRRFRTRTPTTTAPPPTTRTAPDTTYDRWFRTRDYYSRTTDYPVNQHAHGSSHVYSGPSCGVPAGFEITAIILLISLVATTARSAYLLRQIEQTMPGVSVLPPGKMVTKSDQLTQDGDVAPQPVVIGNWKQLNLQNTVNETE